MGLHRLSVAAGCAALVASACGNGDSVEGDVVALDVPPIPLAEGEEVLGRCHSWTLHNEEPVFVQSIRMRGTEGIHHSNWFYVDDDTYDAPDGSDGDGFWDCGDRGFTTQGAALAGGVLFAQSTQALDETQAFDPGAVIALPPHSRIVVDLHLVNTYGESLESDIDLELRTIPRDEVETPLTGFIMTYADLHIQPRARTEVSMECDFASAHQASLGRPLDFRVHYVLPHYHSYGDMLRLELLGGEHDGETLWEVNTRIGEVLGGVPEADMADMTGATGLRMTCGFDNPTDEKVEWGNGDGEMCITFGFTDSERLWSGDVGSGDGELVEAAPDDTLFRYEGPCTVINAPPRGTNEL
ncbi:MAG: hypothetical protein ACOC97_05345 [Myxococcota bacterium]